MLNRRIEPRGDKIEVFVPEDQAERDLLAGIVNHHIPERYSVMTRTVLIVDGVECPQAEWPEFVAFGLMLTQARMTSMYATDSDPGLMDLYFRGYVTTNPEERILIDLVIEDNDEKHLAEICEIVNKKGYSWTVEQALGEPASFMWCVIDSLDQDPHMRTEWLQI